VGSSGQKKRKKTQHQQHLPKVGTTPAEHQHMEREAIADTMGMGGLSDGAKKAILVVVALFFIFAIIGLLILNTF
jgi:hypothetical protein